MSKNYNLYKKSRFKSLYLAIVLILIGFGITYSMVFFVYDEDILSGSLSISSPYGNIFVSEILPKAKKMLASAKSSYISSTKDSIGLSNGKSRTFSVVNKENTNVMLRISVDPTISNTIPLTDMRYGLYLNGDLKKVDYIEKDNSTIIYEGMLLANEELTVSIKFWLDYYSTVQSGIFDASIAFSTRSSQRILSDEIANSNDENIVAVNYDGSLYNEFGDILGYYYTGKNPNNYVWFNCDEGFETGKDHCELWRIVSSANIKASEYSLEYRRVKLVKDIPLTRKFSFNNNNYFGSDVYVYLNSDYYNSLSNTAKKMVLKSVWDYGTINLDSKLSDLYGLTYNSISNRVGLLSAKDYLHTVDKRFYNNNLNDNNTINNTWLSSSNYVMLDNVGNNFLSNNEGLIGTVNSTNENIIRPTVYLSPTVYIKSGTGSSTSPYRLGVYDENSYYEDVEVVGYIRYEDWDERVEDLPNPQPIYIDGSTKVNYVLNDTEDYRFVGWGIDDNTTASYSLGSTVNANYDIYLVAVWEKK